MRNIIAVIWNFDKTIIKDYMQTPIFEEYNYDAGQFWSEVNALPDKYPTLRINKDTIYLNHLIKKAKDRTFKGLNNAKLTEYGKSMDELYFDGIPSILKRIQNQLNDDNNSECLTYREYGITVEHYIVSTGLRAIIEGSSIKPYVKYVWGCDLIKEETENGELVIAETANVLDNTSKTKALFEINKGSIIDSNIDVNSKMDASMRRVPFENMIYIADGPSDVPAFSVVKKYGGVTMAIYPKENKEQFIQVERLRRDGRVDIYAEADYSEGPMASLWLEYQINRIANRIVSEERNKLKNSLSDPPTHLI